MKRIIAQKHNNTASTEKIFDNSAADTSNVVIVLVTIVYLPIVRE